MLAAAALALAAALLTEPLHFLVTLTPLSRLIPPVDHFAPHPGAPFEGYYTRIVTATNATILIILSSVPSAPHNPHYVHFSHLPPPSSSSSEELDLRIDAFPALSDVPGHRHADGFQEFTRVAADIGFLHTTPELQTYSLRLPDPDAEEEEGVVEVEITLTKRTPWHVGDALSTPEGALAQLVRLLPLHWSVFSTKSVAQYSIRRRGEVWQEGSGLAHVEKNWGVSFPSGWTWIQAFSNPQNHTSTSTLSLAGGLTLHQKAFLLGYRSSTRSISFAPPTTLFPFTLPSPFTTATHDSRNGTFYLQARNILGTQRISVDVRGPPMQRGWIGLRCPLQQGHGGVLAWETFEATAEVVVEERGWWWLWWWGGAEWAVVEREVFVGAALEFGGGYSFMVEP